MQTRRDQVQAHAFVVGRLVSAMQRAEPDAPFSPVRRFTIGTICGVLLGGLVVAIFGIVGAVSPGGNKSWHKPGTLVVEKETGARYVIVNNELRPVLNYASARLILGGQPEVARVSRNSLRGMPHGLPVGIQAAPDSLPDLKSQGGRSWQVCSSLRPDVSGTPQPYVTMWVGAKQTGRPLVAGEAFLVRSPSGQVYLVWNNKRMLVPAVSVLGALGYGAVQPSLVGWSWVNAVPAGPDLAPVDVPGRGGPALTVAGQPSVIGQIYKVGDVSGDGAGEFYVMRADGLSPLTPTGAALMLADPRSIKSYKSGQVHAIPLTTASLSAAPRSTTTSVNPQLPVTPPKPVGVGTGQAPCVELAMDAGNGPAARLAVRDVPSATGGAAPADLGGSRLLADRIVVAPGTGLLMRNQPAPGVADGAMCLLVDTGVRYPLPSDAALKALGYQGVKPVPVPAPLLTLLPIGPPLDPAAARNTEPLAPPGPPGVTGGPPAGSFG